MIKNSEKHRLERKLKFYSFRFEFSIFGKKKVTKTDSAVNVQFATR